MKKSVKRFLSTILALTMLCSCMVVMNISTVFAVTLGTSYDAEATVEGFDSSEIVVTAAQAISNSKPTNTNNVSFTVDGSTIPGRPSYQFKAVKDGTVTVTHSDLTKSGQYVYIFKLESGSFEITSETDEEGTTTYSASGTYSIAGSTATSGTTTTADLEAGETYILASRGTTSSITDITYEIASNDPAISGLTAASEKIDIGAETTVTAALKNADNVSYSIEWSVDEGGYATIDGNGTTATVTGVAVGTATITATLSVGETTYDTKTIEIEVYDSSLTRATIDGSVFVDATAIVSDSNYEAIDDGEFLDSNRYFEYYTASDPSGSVSGHVTSYGDLTYSSSVFLTNGNQNRGLVFTTSGSALVQVVFASHSDKDSRTCYVGTQKSTSSGIKGSKSSSNNSDVQTVTCNLTEAGDYYIYGGASIEIFSINVVVGATYADNTSSTDSSIGSYVNGSNSYILATVASDEVADGNTLTIGGNVGSFDSTDTVYQYVSVDKFVFAASDVNSDEAYIYGGQLSGSPANAAAGIAAKATATVAAAE